MATTGGDGAAEAREERRMVRVALLVAAGALALFALLYMSNRIEQTGEPVWLDELTGRPLAADAQLRAVAEGVQRRLLLGTREWPSVEDSEPRLVFVTASDGFGPAEVAMARGEGLADAAQRALALLEARGVDRDWRWLKVDLVDAIDDPLEVGPRGSLAFERGLDGLAFDRLPGRAFLPEEVGVRTLVTSDDELRASNVEKYLAASGSPLRRELDRLWRDGRTPVRRFRTRSLFGDAERLVRLYRGHRELRRVGVDELREGAVAAGDYLRRAVGEGGRFAYSYLPKTDKEKDDYNMLRHAGTVYSMFELYGVTRDAELLAAAESATEFLRGRIVDCWAGGDSASCVEEGGYVKLGGNALAILALAERARATGDRSDLPLMSSLARWMTEVQVASGEFSIHKQRLESGEIDDLVSEYYPGEALFALARLHELGGDPRWLDSAERGADYLITGRDGDLDDDELSHDHWLLYALNELHRLRPRDLYRDHALRLARVIAASQNRDPEYPDWLGSYYRPPRSTPTATRSEGLCAAYELAVRAGRLEQAAAILEAVRLGVDFQLQLQFRPESVLYLPAPRRALGGFPRSLTNFEIRIDYVQHNLSSLLALARILSSGPVPR